MSRPTHSIDEAGWARFAAAHVVGDVVDGHVVSVVPFGAFIRIGEGVDGLAPSSHWSTLPELAARLPVRILAIDVANRRVALEPA
jgi:small subunit ribosomal protein S1